MSSKEKALKRLIEQSASVIITGLKFPELQTAVIRMHVEKDKSLWVPRGCIIAQQCPIAFPTTALTALTLKLNQRSFMQKASLLLKLTILC